MFVAFVFGRAHTRGRCTPVGCGTELSSVERLRRDGNGLGRLESARATDRLMRAAHTDRRRRDDRRPPRENVRREGRGAGRRRCGGIAATGGVLYGTGCCGPSLRVASNGSGAAASRGSRVVSATAAAHCSVVHHGTMAARRRSPGRSPHAAGPPERAGNDRETARNVCEGHHYGDPVRAKELHRACSDRAGRPGWKRAGPTVRGEEPTGFHAGRQRTADPGGRPHTAPRDGRVRYFLRR